MSELRLALANVSKPLDVDPEDTSLDSTMHINEDASSRQESTSKKVSHQLNKKKEPRKVKELFTYHPAAEYQSLSEKFYYRQHESQLYVQD